MKTPACRLPAQANPLCHSLGGPHHPSQTQLTNLRSPRRCTIGIAARRAMDSSVSTHFSNGRVLYSWMIHPRNDFLGRYTHRAGCIAPIKTCMVGLQIYTVGRSGDAGMTKPRAGWGSGYDPTTCSRSLGKFCTADILFSTASIRPAPVYHPPFPQLPSHRSREVAFSRTAPLRAALLRSATSMGTTPVWLRRHPFQRFLNSSALVWRRSSNKLIRRARGPIIDISPSNSTIPPSVLASPPSSSGYLAQTTIVFLPLSPK
jgi:hypothetical protein